MTQDVEGRSGRRAQAARNDVRILDAARAVFVDDPDAPVAAVAERAGVGISALYRRHGSKEDLLRRLCADGLAVYVAAAERAVAADDPWAGFEDFVRDVVAADTHRLTIALAGRFRPGDDLGAEAARAGRLTDEVVARARDAGVLRADLVAVDLGVLFEQLSVVRGGDPARTAELRDRYLALQLDALRVPAAHRALPGPAPDRSETGRRWAVPDAPDDRPGR